LPKIGMVQAVFGKALLHLMRNASITTKPTRPAGHNPRAGEPLCAARFWGMGQNPSHKMKGEKPWEYWKAKKLQSLATATAYRARLLKPALPLFLARK